MPVITIIQQRAGTAAQWVSANPVLAAGEMGIESDTKKFKFGNGTTAWTALGYGVGVNDPAGMTVIWANVVDKPMDFLSNTAANFTSSNPKLPLGTFGYEVDTQKFKIGDGTTFWNALRYSGGGGDPASVFLLMGA